MDYNIIFLTAVLGIAAIHLLTNLVNFLSSFKKKAVEAKSVNAVRDDWYMFFHTSDLSGNQSIKRIEPEASEDLIESQPSDEACEDCPPQESYA